MALSPEWKNLPRRKCDDCGKSYKPTRPRRILNGREELGFCSPNCRKSYHKHGGAYRKLKAEMQKMVAREMAGLEKRLREIAREYYRYVSADCCNDHHHKCTNVTGTCTCACHFIARLGNPTPSRALSGPN